MKLQQSKAYWYYKRKQRKKNIRQDGHSQYGQDLTVFDLLGRPSKGNFLDIGANDGITFSNSLFFEEKGWAGICVEPHPVIFKTLQTKRKCNLVNACISDKDGHVDFLVVEGVSHMLSGILEFLDQRHIERIDKEVEENGGNKKVVQVETLSPSTLLERFDIESIEYLSIDTEGCELPILKNFDLNTIPVKAIGVENGTRSPELFNYLTSQGYNLIKCVGCDEIYMKR